MKTRIDWKEALDLLERGAVVRLPEEELRVSAVGRHRDGRRYIGLGHADDDHDKDRPVVAAAVVLFLPAELDLLTNHA